MGSGRDRFVRSLTHRPVAEEARPGAGIVRLSIGLEHIEDLMADLERALEAAAATGIRPAVLANGLPAQ